MVFDSRYAQIKLLQNRFARLKSSLTRIAVPSPAPLIINDLRISAVNPRRFSKRGVAGFYLPPMQGNQRFRSSVFS
jgi:hypothetical protein